MASGKPVAATVPEIRRRTAICRECPDFAPWENNPAVHRCRQCGCWLDGKVLSKINLATERCPVGKWEVSP